MQRIFFICGILLISPFLAAQVNLRPGDWQAYLNHRRAVASVSHMGWIFSITSGGMFSFDPATEEIQTYSTVEGLSDINPTTIYQDPRNEVVYIGFQDGSINFFQDPGEIRIITDISRNNSFVAKAIRDFTSDENFLYVATDFGVVIFRLENRLPAFTVQQFGNKVSRLPVASVTIFNGRIWATLEEGELYSAPVGFPNLSDPNIWRLENGANGLPLGLDILEAKGNSQAIYARTENTVYVNRGDQWEISPEFNNRYNHIFVQKDMVGASFVSETKIVPDIGAPFVFFITGAVEDVLLANGEYYIAKTFRGVDRRLSSGEIVDITPSGPGSNNATEIATYNGEIYIAPRGYRSGFVPDIFRDGIYYFKPETGWEILDSEEELDPERVNTSFARAFYDRNTGTAYLGSFGKGIVVLKNGELQTFYDCENSGLSTISGVCLPGDFNFIDTRISGLSVDDQGYLWVTQTLAEEPLLVKSPEDEWFAVPANRFRTSTEFIGMISDDLGSKWIINRRNGLIVYNDNGTPEDLQDDRIVNLNPIRTNRDGDCDPTNEVLSIARDLDGFIWVGTNKGVVVYFDPFSAAFGEQVEGTRPIFNGRCLLENEQILSIGIDGANRKWFATENGIFLMNETGEELIAHFTTGNSPLLSDRVNHVSIDQATGQVSMATDLGVIGYQSQATESVVGCQEVLVYPNPVFTDYDGDIVIKGSARGATVKITTVSGRLVRELRANGGTTTWDGRDIRGDKVHSGVYLAMMADDDGENACIGKFTVIRR